VVMAGLVSFAICDVFKIWRRVQAGDGKCLRNEQTVILGFEGLRKTG
jgi:hypothetical protein